MTNRKLYSTFIVFISVGLLIFPLKVETCPASVYSSEDYEIDSVSEFIIMNHEIYVDMKNLQEFYVDEKLEIRNPNNISVSSINLWINQSFQDLSVQDGYGNLSIDLLTLPDSSNQITVYFREDMYFNSNQTIWIYYNLSETNLEEIEDYYRFSFTSHISYYTDKLSISVNLPYDCYINYDDVLQPIVPLPDNEIHRQRILMQWVILELDPTENQVILLHFDYRITKPLTWAYVVGPILGVAAGVGGSYVFMRRRTKRTLKKLGDVFLTDTQKHFVKLIMENNGRMLQKDLCEQTGFSKSNVSRTLIPLEEQGLIRREKRGRNFIVYLTDEGFKVIE